ncbi:MAG: hypothetical protein AAGJ84_04235 [Pseudomonadota bacterium]
MLPLCFVPACSVVPNPQHLSVNEAITSSAELDGSTISVSGYLIAAFEDHNLYATRRDARDKIRTDSHCLALEFTQEQFEKWQSHDAAKVVITGRLNADFCGTDVYCPSSCNQIGLQDITIVSD